MSRGVVQCKKLPYDIYVGRAVARSGFKASVWGNPFKLWKDCSREEIMAKYRAWLRTQTNLMTCLPELKGKVLGCWCALAVRHGDILAELTNR
jgi:hypothetical protein